MTLLNVERIKLFSTRSPYWCLVAIVVAALGFATLFGLIDNGRAAISYLVMQGVGLGMSIFMVLAALSITTEYRFGTIRNTFLAAPRRPAVLAAKTLLIALLGAVVGVVVSIAAFFLAKALATAPLVPLELSTGDDWRQVIGYGPLVAIAGVIAVSVGAIIRQSAGAVAILLLWPLLLESLFQRNRTDADSGFAGLCRLGPRALGHRSDPAATPGRLTPDQREQTGQTLTFGPVPSPLCRTRGFAPTSPVTACPRTFAGWSASTPGVDG
jgi:ABC-2 type transport system permease protein